MPDFIVPGLNPLEIPEIIAMVGQTIPLCRRVMHCDFFNPLIALPITVFAPRDLLACTVVSRTWRRILLPILWRTYDGALMRYVPASVLRANSIYFRTFRDQFGYYHSGPFLTTVLSKLTVSQQHDWAVPLMLSNPALRHLTWTGLGKPFLNLEYSALAGLANLRDLCLSNWNLSGRQLAVIICASPRLRRLSLSCVDGALDLDGMLILFALEEISLGYIPAKSQCLLDLVQFCPSLQRISFLGTWVPEQERDLLSLGSRIRSSCPDLISIQFSAAYCFGTDGFNTLEDFEYAALAQSTQHLSNFAAEISHLGYMLTDSLIDRFESLVTIELGIRRRRQHQHTHDGGGRRVGADDQYDEDLFMDVVNTARILSNCSRLRVFRLSSAENLIEMDTALELFATPWACLELEVLSLGQISLPPTTQLDCRAPVSSSFGEYGWFVQPQPGVTESAESKGLASKATQSCATSSVQALSGSTLNVDGDTRTSNQSKVDLWTFGSEFKRKLFPQVSLLTVLRELCLNQVKYARL
ncbi:hypothetical protein EC968_006495 [Mortierella alpina]|nr:hypothetical protein EC968_006495 [Mortierella alpina]